MRTYIIIAFSMLILTSCIVSKKKFQALEKRSKKSVDSMQTVLNNFANDYNNQRNVFIEDGNKKRFIIDSLDSEKRRLRSDTLSLKNSLRDAINEYQNEKKRLMAFEKELDLKSKLIDSLNKSLSDKQKRLSELEAMIDQNKSETIKLKDIINQALNVFDKSELSVYIKDGKVYVALEEKLLFKTGSAKVDKKGEDAIKKVGEVLEKNQNIDILIEGHTDNVGTADYNWKLSTDRALSIVNILQSNSKIDPKRITASGRGMYQPIADNSITEGKQKNRRIDIILVPKLDSLYKMMNEGK